MIDTDMRLDQIRGPLPPKRHDARTIAALTANPGCARRAVLDAAGVDKQRVATDVGFPAPFGQSQFAFARGQTFESQVKADGCAELLRLLRERLDLPLDEVAYADLASVGGNDTQPVRHARARQVLGDAAAGGPDTGTLFDHPLLTLDIGGRRAYLEPDLIAFRSRGRFHVIEIKSFAIIDGQADGAKVAAAVTQAAVYVLALRGLLAEQGHAGDRVADEVILVCPEDFSNRPTAVLVDVRKQLTVLRRQLARMARVNEILDAVPDDVTFDLGEGAGASASPRPPADIASALHRIDARYAPECLDTCELSYFCRHEARDETTALGRSVRDELGGVESLPTVLALAAGRGRPAPEQAEAALMLSEAARLRHECLPARPPAVRPDGGAGRS